MRGANPRGSSINQAGRHITGAAAQPPRRLPPRSPNQPTAVNNAISQSSQGSQTVSPVPGLIMLPTLQCVPKNETRVIVNILYSCKSIAVKFSM